ncbi:tRNA-guanine transglycosylase family protein [Talaromyces proteolyticus]|uniref:Queuine tRNA-ribosyltransferase accessory subunit 2 n=1 Tax=Talaromyces proteolyticus TaxID=1131652 RepID=A0AAD4L0Y3_9EURO|nr:tRNA-guanine transglycosylase family protein [Talaromyces proteolyticus]KAH8702116.1 tRNA-guanine transglycosylase family protein [Talaromyces proteolyticus]
MVSEAAQLPEQMPSPFSLLHPAPSVLAPRVGKFVIPGRKIIQTPHYVAITSRGTIPHLAPDVIREHTSIGSLYLGLEDFLEKAPQATPPILNIPQAPHESRLRKFIAARDDDILVLGTRRTPPVVTPQSNLANGVAVLTSVGFHHLEAPYWLDSLKKLRPDIVIGMSDICYGYPPGVKRREKMVDRTHAYTRDATNQIYHETDPTNSEHRPLYFAPILPLENTQQGLYLDDLVGELRPNISGLALYDAASLDIIPEKLGDLPRLCFSEPATPQQVLREIALGADILTIPFIGNLSNAGIALDFSFLPNEADDEASSSTPKPLAVDFWDPSHAISLAPLKEGCECYACQNHHRAYVCHLLSVKEMLAWTLLQIHNYHVMDLFFTNVRRSIANGTFEADSMAFERRYESSFPEQTGQGPRLRGYSSYVSKREEPKRNAPAYGRLNDALEKYAESQSSVATPDTDAEGLEEKGMGEKSGI